MLDLSLRSKRVFVSGGAGVIGTALVELLLEAGATVFVGDLKPCPSEWGQRLRYRMGDLNFVDERELLEFAPEFFFHLAATFERSTESYPFYEENFHHNAALSHHLMSCLKKCTELKKIVFASSYLIYDPALYSFQKPQQSPAILNENSHINPRNICGASKLFHEKELHFFEPFVGTDVQWVAARIFRVYGCGSRDVISRWIRDALSGKKLSLYSSENMFDYIFAEDVAEGLLKLSLSRFSGVINLGSGRARTISSVVEILKLQFPHLEVELQAVSPEEKIEASQGDIHALSQITQWKPCHSLETAIPKIVAFEKKQLLLPPPKDNRSAILISSISKKRALILAVRHAAEKIGCFSSILGCDADEECIAKYNVDEFWTCPSDSERSRDGVLQYCLKYGVQAIIPTRDGELAFFSEHRQWFKEQGIEIMISKPASIEMCLDKKAFADCLNQHGSLAIPTYVSLAHENTPCWVVKERYGSGSCGLGLKLSKKDAFEHAKKLEKPIFQPYIEGKEYTIDVYRDGQKSVKGCVVRERNFVVCGESQVTTTVRKPLLEKLCAEAAEILDLYGHATFQALESCQGESLLIECNPRFGGASTLSVAAGLDTFYWFLLEVLEQPLASYPFNRIRGELRQVRAPADQVFPW